MRLSMPSAHDVTQMLSDACWSGAVQITGVEMVAWRAGPQAWPAA